MSGGHEKGCISDKTKEDTREEFSEPCAWLTGAQVQHAINMIGQIIETSGIEETYNTHNNIQKAELLAMIKEVSDKMNDGQVIIQTSVSATRQWKINRWIRQCPGAGHPAHGASYKAMGAAYQAQAQVEEVNDETEFIMPHSRNLEAEEFGV